MCWSYAQAHVATACIQRPPTWAYDVCHFVLIPIVRVLVLLQGTRYNRDGTVDKRGVFKEHKYTGAADSAVRVHRYSHLLSATHGGSLRTTTRFAPWNGAAAACGGGMLLFS